MKIGKQTSLDKKSKNYYNHLQRYVSYKDMADDNFTTNQELLGDCVHGIENPLSLLAKTRRMVIIIDKRNDEMFPP